MDSIIVNCGACGGKLRIPQGRSGEVRCGHCGAQRHYNTKEAFPTHPSRPVQETIWQPTKRSWTLINILKNLAIAPIVPFLIIPFEVWCAVIVLLGVLGIAMLANLAGDALVGRIRVDVSNSSVFEDLYWQPTGSGRLVATFRRKKGESPPTYTYEGVTRSELDAIIESPSLGTSFNVVVRPRFRCYDVGIETIELEFFCERKGTPLPSP